MDWNEIRQKKDLHIIIPTNHGTATNFDFLLCAGYIMYTEIYNIYYV